MTPPIDGQKDLETLVAAIRRWENAPRFDLPLKPYEGWATMAGIQRLLQMPDLPLNLREVLAGVGRRLQSLVCDTPDIDDLVERGWDVSQDQPTDPAPGNLGLPPGEPQVAPQHAGSVWECSHPECGFDSTCGDCVGGRCHWGGERSEKSTAAAEAGHEYVDPVYGRCGCARHEASVRARQLHEDLNRPKQEPR